jgi:hypothetical protein
MVIYTYKNPKLFFLHFLLAFAELFEGLIAVLTLGCVRFSISYAVLFKVYGLEMRMRIENKERRSGDPWPRFQISPLYRRK